MKGQHTTILLAAMLLLLALPGRAQAQEETTAPRTFVADVEVAPDVVTFAIDGKYAGYVLEVGGRGEFYLRKHFGPDERPALPVKTEQGLLADGSYTFQVTAQPYISEKARAAMMKAREDGDGMAVQKIRDEIGLDQYAMVYTINLGVADGRFINPVNEEPKDEYGARDSQQVKGADAGAVQKSTIRLTGRRLDATLQPAGFAPAPTDATGLARPAGLPALTAGDLPPFQNAAVWHEVIFENMTEDGTPVTYQGFVRAVRVDGQGQLLQAYMRELPADGAPPDVWTPGFFRADDAGSFAFLDLATVAAQAAAPLFDYVTDEHPAHGAEGENMPFFHIGSGSIDGSLCVGNDCIANEAFGFDTIRIKENNLRIKADDTSSTASFPRTDWQITFNESTNGGAEKFAIDDITNGRTPFTIEDNAPSNSLYVEDAGRVGFGTATPVVELHSRDGDSPTLRLEQDNSSGFTPQTWDVAGNETNFFIRDVTNGSLLPFKIRPSAPTNSIVMESGRINFNQSSVNLDFQVEADANENAFFLDASAFAGDGAIGIGTNAPVSQLDVRAASGTPEVRIAGNNNPAFRFQDLGDNYQYTLRLATGNNNFVIRDVTAAVDRIILASTGDVTFSGNVSKAGGSFRIDHPLDPANKFLYHSFVESPDMMNVYNGNVVLDANGEAVVEMADWFEALNRDFRYQLTAIGAPGPNLYIAEEINGNRFRIAGGTPGMKVSWQVTGVRQDRWAEEHRIPVEVDKPAGVRGLYLHPQEFGQPLSRGIGYELPEVRSGTLEDRQ